MSDENKNSAGCKVDLTEYTGPRGSAPPGSGIPKSPDEEREWLRKVADAETRDLKRGKEQGKIAQLTAERAKAAEAGDQERVRELTSEIRRIGDRIQSVFGY